MILSDMESLRRKLDFLLGLLMHTEGSGKLNISMQLVATSLDLVLNIFMNAPTTTSGVFRRGLVGVKPIPHDLTDEQAYLGCSRQWRIQASSLRGLDTVAY